MSEEETITTTQSTANSPIWMMLFVGLAMFLVGAAVGYFGRPLLAKEEESAATPVAELPDEVVPGANETQAAGAAELMEFLEDETRHFTGDADAPVTIIEFSDFQ